MTESKAELNAGLIIVTGHAPVPQDDVAMNPGGPLPEHTADADMPPAPSSTGCEARAPKSRLKTHNRPNEAKNTGRMG